MTIDLNNLPTDPEALAAAFNTLEAGGDIETSAPAPAPAPAPEPAPAPAPTQASSEGDGLDSTTEADADGVATRDGKHIIPYSVLRSERERATRAEQMLADAKAQLELLQAQAATPGQAANQGANDGESARTSTVSDLSDEDLETLKEDFPTVYKGVMAAMKAAQALEARMQPVADSVAEAEAENKRTAAETVQESIDRVPKLAHIQATDPEAFELARQFDATLRAQARWANVPMAERFAKVIEMVEASNGAIDLPAQASTSRTSPEDLRKAALAKASAATKGGAPTSLSEFPVGDPPAQDERQAVESMTPLQLANKLGSMSADQLNAYFETL